MKINLTILWVVFCAISLPGGIQAQEAPEAEAEKPEADMLVLRLKEGQSLRDLATKYLGGPEFILELLKFNNITNPSTVTAGQTISVPVKIRKDALVALAEAETALAQAVDAMADKFAKPEYAEAKGVFEAARASRNAAEYDKTVALSRLARVQADLAIAAAARNAIINQNATLTAVKGLVEVSVDAGKTWSPGKLGQKLPGAARLRAGKGAQGEISFADGSKVKMPPDSEFVILEDLLDQRTGKRNSRLKVVLGNILGEIKPRDEKKGESYEIETDGGSIAIRGTALRVGADGAGVTTLAVLHGLTDFSAGDGQVAVPGNFGTWAKGGEAPAEVVELLPAPVLQVLDREGARITTARQELLLHWPSIRDRRLDHYHLEIATDASFNEVVQDHRPEETRVITDALPEGTYVCRISSVDRNGLEGSPGDLVQLTIKQNLDYTIVHRGTSRLHQGVLHIDGANGFYIEPAQADDHSITAVECRVDDGPFTVIEDFLGVQAEGKHRITLRVRAADGALGAEQSLDVWVDRSGPALEASANASVDPETGVKTALVQGKASDPSGVKSVQYRLHGGAWKEYTKPFKVALIAGQAINWQAVDQVGNRSSALQTIQGQGVKRKSPSN